MRNRSPFLLNSAVLAAAILVSLNGANAQPPEMPPAQVEVALAEERIMAPLMDVTGTVVSLNDSQIAAEVEGVLTSIANVGAQVEQGDIIATIDSRLLDIALRRATAALARLEADMVFRRQDVERFQDLAARDNASRSRLQEVIAQRDMIEQDIADARARVEQTQGDKNRAQIRAPFSGTIAARIANKGEYVRIGANVVRLVDTKNIEVAMPAPISIMPYLMVGNSVDVSTGEQITSLPIRTVVPVGDNVSRMVEVRLSAASSGWVTGMPVKVSLPRGEAHTSIAVPRDAVVLKSGAMYVYKVTDNMTAERVNTDLRNAIGLWVPVTSGVSAGDRIVIRGAERLNPGQSVVISQPGR
ncbi:efflux RND transporter periplasmic adaptor subunit [Kordiimonas aquimaris]|uniref:efflux RND transporter periplasmic adaptor subunit n=1 Tax=Kordiimonas aquimaris TaxID=707591 RepID=UPI0021CE31FF|nr:efflux RND transporter periplasmic adaptor subunit [Kordiimonas aquimaris]